MSDIKRNLEDKINTLLTYFPVVIILGIRQGGKTTLAKMIRPDWKYFDFERGSDYDRITSDFEFFFKQYSKHMILDEVQTVPEIFKELRSIIDRDRSIKNRFILTGSSSLELVKNLSESLAGRVGIIELGTLKMNEYYELPLPKFYSIFKSLISPNTTNFIKEIESGLTHKEVIDFFMSGGFPEPVLSKDKQFYQLWMENYYNTYIQRDIRKLFPRLNIINYRRFIHMLTSLTGTIINRSEVGRSLDTSEVTVKEYLDIAHGSYLWRTIPSFEKSRIKSIIKMPNGNFRDSGLLHYLKNIKNTDDLFIYPQLGRDFESFVIEELLKGLDVILDSHWNYYYYRTKNGAEIDLILEGEFGLLPIEIKYGSSIRLKQLTSLQRMIDLYNLPLGIVINNSENVEFLTDKIVQIPAGLI